LILGLMLLSILGLRVVAIRCDRTGIDRRTSDVTTKRECRRNTLACIIRPFLCVELRNRDCTPSMEDRRPLSDKAVVSASLRRPTVNIPTAKVQRLRAQGLSWSRIAAATGVAKATLLRHA
jgi:hypothetical protein